MLQFFLMFLFMFRCQQWAASQFGKMAFQSSSQTQVRYAVDMFHVDFDYLGYA